MTKEQSIEVEGNKLIAEFHGWKYAETPKKKGKGYWDFQEWGKAAFDIRFMKYHSSWDWFLPAVKKLNKLIQEDKAFKEMRFDWDIYESMRNWINDVELENAFSDFVTMLEWYNQNKQS